MVDYSIDGDFDIHLNEWNDFVVVDGIDEFEQDVVIQLHENLRGLFNGNTSQENAIEKIELQVTRVARQFGVIDSIRNISITEVRDEFASYEVSVTYYTGDDFSEQF